MTSATNVQARFPLHPGNAPNPQHRICEGPTVGRVTHMLRAPLLVSLRATLRVTVGRYSSRISKCCDPLWAALFACTLPRLIDTMECAR